MGKLYLDERRSAAAFCMVIEAYPESDLCCNPSLVALQETFISSAESVPHILKEGSASSMAAERACSMVAMFAWYRRPSLTCLRTIDRCQNYQSDDSE